MCVCFLVPSTVWLPSWGECSVSRARERAWVRPASSNLVLSCVRGNPYPVKRPGELGVGEAGQEFSRLVAAGGESNPSLSGSWVVVHQLRKQSS